MKNDVSDGICMYRCRFIYKFLGGIVLGGVPCSFFMICTHTYIRCFWFELYWGCNGRYQTIFF